MKSLRIAGRPSTVVLATTVVLASVIWSPLVRGGDRPRGRALPTARMDSVRNFTLKDLDGKSRSLSETRDATAVVLAWTAPGCPVAMVYAPRVAALAKDYAAKGVRFFGVDSNAGESVDELKDLVQKTGITFPVLLDDDGALAQTLLVPTTTTVVLLDENWRVRYRGAVDDQYAVGTRKEKVENAWLADALEEVLARRKVTVESTDAPGCPITFPAPKAPAAGSGPAVTWAGDVASIVHRRCIACHAPEQGAPFSLRSYDDAKARTATIKAAVEDGRMPPWHASGPKGMWSNDRRLDPEEKDKLLCWIAAGAPEGDKAKAPAPPPVPAKDAWDLGQPDAVLSFAEPQKVPAEGVVPYRFVEVPTDYSEDRWVEAIEVRPGAPDVVHHVLVAFLPPGRRDRRAAFVPTNGFFAAMVPGARSLRYPPGMAKRLPKGATLLFQMHYTPNGVATEDVTRLGLVFSAKPPEHEVFTAGAFAARLEIPPGDPRYETSAALPVPWNVKVLAFMPHMHLRGSSFKYAIWRPGGQEETTVCDVPVYDFNWQTPYRLTTPLSVAKGSMLRCTATFDNSEANPYNPDPKATVRWGDQTWDEMMIGYVDYVKD